MSDQKINLLGTPCPINFVRTKLALDEMDAEQVLEVCIDDGEAIESVPASVEAEGHKILEKIQQENGWLLKIQKQ